ncbi:MAG: hypothetical protein ACREQQ_05160 [Candidatus Binatia bacterium]
MEPSERNELVREVATIIAEVTAQSNERIFGKMFELEERTIGLQERMIGLQEQTIALEKQQLQILDHISERQDALTELQVKATEVLGLILAKLRSN